MKTIASMPGQKATAKAAGKALPKAVRKTAPPTLSKVTVMLRELQSDQDALNVRIEKLRQRVA